MTALFADTFYYLALVNKGDRAHERALALSRLLTQSIITTGFVLTEVADALAGTAQRPVLLALLESLLADKKVTIVPPSQDLFDLGLSLFARRLDKEWSLTDCTSFVIMDRMQIFEALTGDHHYEQAGFRALLT